MKALFLRSMKSPAPVILILFTLIVMAHNLRVPATYLYYYTATEDFIERWCENKDRPELNCDGQCYLAKMLQNSSDETNPLPKEQLSWPENLMFISQFTEACVWAEEDFPPLNGMYFNSYRLVIAQDIFHPPSIIS